MSMVWFVLFWKNLLNRKVNSIDKCLESAYIIVAYDGNILSSPYVSTFVKKVIFSFFFPFDILHIKLRGPLA